MDFLNIGGLELLFLIGVAVIIVGPARAAEMAGEIGRLIARARRTLNSLTDDLRAQAREETEPLRSARESVQEVESELRRPLDTRAARPNRGRTTPVEASPDAAEGASPAAPQGDSQDDPPAPGGDPGADTQKDRA